MEFDWIEIPNTSISLGCSKFINKFEHTQKDSHTGSEIDVTQTQEHEHTK